MGINKQAQAATGAIMSEPTEITRLQEQAKAQLAKRNWGEALALYEQILAQQQEAEPAERAKTQSDIASVYLAQRRWTEAQTLLEQILPALRDGADQEAYAVALNNLAAAHHEQGEIEPALQVYTEALELRREMGDRVGEAKTLRNLSLLYARRGNMVKAKALLNQALVIAKRSGARDMVRLLRKSFSQLRRRR